MVKNAIKKPARGVVARELAARRVASSDTGTPDYYARAIKKNLPTAATEAMAIQATGFKDSSSHNSDGNGGNGNGNVINIGRQSQLADQFNTPYTERAGYSLCLDTQVSHCPQSQNVGYIGYEYHFGDRSADPSPYFHPERRYTPAPKEQHRQGNFFKKIPHIDHGYLAYSQGYGTRQPSSPSDSYPITGYPRHYDQFEGSSFGGAMEDHPTDNRKIFTASPYRQESAPPVGHSEQAGDIEIEGGTDEASPNGDMKHIEASCTARPTKQESISPKGTPVEESLNEAEDAVTLASDDDLFVAFEEAASAVQGPPAPKGHRGRKTARSNKNNLSGASTRVSITGTASRLPAGAIDKAPRFGSSMAKINAALKLKNPNSKGMIPSRSDRKARWETHTGVRFEETGDLSTAGKKKRQSKKLKGLNNPENILVVNLKDVKSKSFQEIATIINTRRSNKGEDPNQTANSINCRYNRTAPHIYQMQNIPFVRIADRAKVMGKHKYTREQEELIWSIEMDELLVDLEAEFRTNKWKIIGKAFAKRTGHEWASPTEVANRFVHI